MEAALLSILSAAIMSEISHFTADTSRCMQLGDSKMNYTFLATVSSTPHCWEIQENGI